MLNLTADLCKWTQDADGTWLSLRTKQAREVAEAFPQGKLHDVEIKVHRERRSLSANAYMWVLLGELAKVLDTDKEELYRDYVRRYGLFKDFTLTEREASTFAVVWGKQGVAWFAEEVDYAQEKKIIRAYYGSSCYNTKQMSRLIDAIIDDCKGQQIQTITPKEKALLLDAWETERDEV